MPSILPSNGDPNIINVKSYGAKGDGVTDDSSAFITAIASAESMARRNMAPSSDGNKLGTATIYIPSGTYLIKSAEALIRSSYTVRTFGLTIQGAGANITQILFQPTTANSYLIKNKDAWQWLTIADISFDSNSIKNNFMDSYSSGGAQKYIFDKCVFTGSWNNCIFLEGSNNNSEFSFYSCSWYGSIKKGVYVDANGSDQFVNYNFYACNFEVSEGDFLHFEKGGNITIWGGSFIHYGTNGGTFFRLLGTDHYYGTERFMCIGTRMEHRTNNSKLIECEWANGVVSFINVDSSSSMHLRTSTAISAIFNSINTKLPVIKFDNCRVIGVHQFTYLVNSWSNRHNIKYENCTFEEHDDPSTFLSVIAADNTNNKGGRPVITFTNCRGSGGSNNVRNIWDNDNGFLESVLGMTTKKVVSIKNPDGKFPYAKIPTIDFYLPLNSLITNIRLFWPSNATSSKSNKWTFTVRTSEATPTILAKVDGGGKVPLSSGFNVETTLFFQCNTAVKRHLVFECNSSVDQVVDGCMCLVEFIG